VTLSAVEAPVVEAARVEVTVMAAASAAAVAAAVATFTVAVAVVGVGKLAVAIVVFAVVGGKATSAFPEKASKSDWDRFVQQEALVPEPWHGT
jgi:hypothetical protein